MMEKVKFGISELLQQAGYSSKFMHCNRQSVQPYPSGASQSYEEVNSVFPLLLLEGRFGGEQKNKFTLLYNNALCETAVFVIKADVGVV